MQPEPILLLVSVIACITSVVSINYKILVKTGNLYNAGAVGNVYLGMTGSRGYVAPTLLDNPNHDDFEPNSLDTFYISVPNPIGPICSIKLRKADGGKWYVEYVTVVEPRSTRKPKFLFGISITTGDTKTYERTQPAVNGNWGEWGKWSVCTNCEGSTTRQRACNNSEPSCGGKPCEGDNDEDESCSDLHCSDENDEKKSQGEPTEEGDPVIPIAGGVGGFLVMGMIVVIAVYFIIKKRKSKRRAKSLQTMTQTEPQDIIGSTAVVAPLQPPSREDVVPYSYVDYEDQSGYLDLERTRRTLNAKGDRTKCLPLPEIKDSVRADPEYQTEYTGDYVEDGNGYMVTPTSTRRHNVTPQRENDVGHGRQSEETRESLNLSPLRRNSYEGSTNYIDFEHGYTQI